MMYLNYCSIKIRISSKARTFEGIGGISSNGTTKLLMDYPEQIQNDILDLLFRPNFGASLQHLKLEIGSDANSSSGTEPSHMRRMDDLCIERGAGLWLAKKAKKINKDIKLGALRWGLPKWVDDDSKKLIYYKTYLDEARKKFGIDFDYLGADENEGEFDRDWTVNVLRKGLDESGYSDLKIIAADSENDWFISDMVSNDEQLKKSIYAMGIHYTCNSPENAKKIGLPLWLSEDLAPMHTGFNDGCLETAERIIRMYTDGRMVKFMFHPLFEGNYETTPFAYKGMLTATWPWSGHYKIEPGLWIAAHFTQFIKPGWIYLDDGCFWENDWGIVSLISPNGKDISIIALNRSDESKKLDINLNDILTTDRLNVFKSDESTQFKKQKQIIASGGIFYIEIAPNSIYSLTNTKGQCKGEPCERMPEETDLLLPYADDFSACPVGAAPGYTLDQAGAFEIYESEGKKVLAQVIDKKHKPKDWCRRKTPNPYTLVGSVMWMNYSVKVSCKLEENEGYAMISGRVNAAPKTDGLPHGYNLILFGNGEWKLLIGDEELDSGVFCDVAQNSWFELELKFKHDLIEARIEDMPVSKIKNSAIPSGQAALGSGYNITLYKNLQITPVNENINVNCHRLDDVNTNIRYSDGFMHIKAPYNAYSRTLTKGETPGEYMKLEYSSQFVSVIAKKGPDCGMLDIYLDGKYIRTEDAYSETEIYREAICSFFFDEKKKHILKLIVSDKRNKKSGGSGIYIDAVEID